MAEKQYIISELLPKFIKLISQNYEIDKLVLYGSYAKDEATEQSDIDIAVVLKGGSVDERINNTNNFYKIALSLDSRIEPRCFYKEEVDTAEPASILYEIMKTGLTIN